jgi:LPS O-antigen subunit length determinant protein (WzzB/FepE family)
MADEIRLAAPPTIPIVKDSPKRSQIAAMAAAIGLVLGLLIAVGRERGGPRMAALRRAWGRQPA